MRVTLRNAPKSDYRQQGSEKMGGLGRTPEQEAQTSGEKGLCRCNTEKEGYSGIRVYSQEVYSPPRPLLWPVMLSKNPLLSLIRTLALRLTETSSLPYSLEGMLGRTMNSRDWATQILHSFALGM